MLTGTGALQATAQAGLPGGAYVTAEGLVIDGAVVVPGDPTTFRHLRWSENGRYLAFQQVTDRVQVHLHDTTANQTRTLTEAGGFLPPAFDGSTVYYTADPRAIEQTADGPILPVTVYRQAVDAPQAEPTGDIRLGVGCGGGSPYPMDAVYNQEAGFGGRGLLLAAQAGDLLFSTGCNGQGVARFDPERGTSSVIDPNLSRATLSPNGEALAGVDETNGAIIVLTLADDSRRQLTPSAPVDQLTWGNTGTLYYSTRTLLETTLPVTADEGMAVEAALGIAADSIPQFQVSVYRLRLDDGGSTLVFSEPGWAVGQLHAEGSTLTMSVIANGESWVEALAGGAIDPTAPDSYRQAWLSVGVAILQMPTSGGDPIDIAQGVYQIRPR